MANEIDIHFYDGVNLRKLGKPKESFVIKILEKLLIKARNIL